MKSTASEASFQSTATGPSTLPTNRTNSTPRQIVSARGSERGQGAQRDSSRDATPRRSERGQQRSRGKTMQGRFQMEDADVQNFDLGTFFNFAEWYEDDPYMCMALGLFEKSPPGTVLRSSHMVAVIARKYEETREADPSTMDERDKVVGNRVKFTLPLVHADGYLTWDKVSYRLPHERKDRESRKALLQFLDNTDCGRMTIEDLKTGFARIATLPGLDNPENILEETITRSQRAVQELMLDGTPRHDDDILAKEFRVFLMFLQGFFDLWEIFYEVDSSGDEYIKLNEFVKCAPVLKEWGMKDPLLTKNPQMVFAQIDKDDSGYVSFGEFADFCVRKGIMTEIAKELNSQS